MTDNVSERMFLQNYNYSHGSCNMSLLNFSKRIDFGTDFDLYQIG